MDSTVITALLLAAFTTPCVYFYWVLQTKHCVQHNPLLAIEYIFDLFASYILRFTDPKRFHAYKVAKLTGAYTPGEF